MPKTDNQSRDDRLAQDVSDLKSTTYKVIIPQLNDISDTLKKQTYVLNKDYEREINGEDGIRARVKEVEKYIESNKPGISLSSSLSKAWVQILIFLLIGGGVLAWVLQTMQQGTK